MAYKFNPLSQSLDLVPSNDGAWAKYTVTYSDLATAATSNNITLFTLAAKGTIEGVIIKHSTAFSGGALATYTVSIGVAGDLAGIASAFDVFQAVSNTAYQSTMVLAVPNFSSSTAIKIAAISTGANLNAATAGSVDIWVKTSVIQ